MDKKYATLLYVVILPLVIIEYLGGLNVRPF
jgi:hypothetical protein